MTQFSGRSTLLKYFNNMDKKEVKVRSKIDTLIKIGMIEMVKKDIDKKKEEEKEEEKPVVKELDELIITKKKKKKKGKKMTKK